MVTGRRTVCLRRSVPSVAGSGFWKRCSSRLPSEHRCDKRKVGGARARRLYRGRLLRGRQTTPMCPAERTTGTQPRPANTVASRVRDARSAGRRSIRGVLRQDAIMGSVGPVLSGQIWSARLRSTKRRHQGALSGDRRGSPRKYSGERFVWPSRQSKSSPSFFEEYLLI